MKIKVILFLVLCLSPKCFATVIDGASIKRLMLDRSLDGRVFIELDRSQDQKIGCHTNTGWEYVLDITDEFGKAMYSMLLSLQASGKPAYFRGKDNCSVYSQIETLRRIEAK